MYTQKLYPAGRVKGTDFRTISVQKRLSWSLGHEAHLNLINLLGKKNFKIKYAERESYRRRHGGRGQLIVFQPDVQGTPHYHHLLLDGMHLCRMPGNIYGHLSLQSFILTRCECVWLITLPLAYTWYKRCLIRPRKTLLKRW